MTVFPLSLKETLRHFLTFFFRGGLKAPKDYSERAFSPTVIYTFFRHRGFSAVFFFQKLFTSGAWALSLTKRLMTDFTDRQARYHEERQGRRNKFLNFLRSEPIRSRLLAYARRHGIKGDTSDENFVLMEAFGRVCAAKVLRELGCPFHNAGLTDTLDGTFLSGGTEQVIEIKLRNLLLSLANEKWDWQIDATKADALISNDGWLFHVWIDSPDCPNRIEWALWHVTEVPEITESWKTVPSCQAADARAIKKKMKGVYLKDAKYRGYFYANFTE